MGASEMSGNFAEAVVGGIAGVAIVFAALGLMGAVYSAITTRRTKWLHRDEM
jgi:hypothetical protein